MAKKKNIDPLELGGPDIVNDIEGNDEFTTTELIIDEVEEPAEEEVATLDDAISLDDDPPPPNLDAFLDSIEDFTNRDIRPDDTVFVKVADDLYVSGKVVAIDGEAPCYGLQIKALAGKVVAVHVSRVEKTAEPDNVKRRLRFSNKTLKKWATPAE